MRARKYNKRISIYQTTTTQNEYGGSVITDELITSSWCEISTVSNNSKFSQRLTSLGVIDPTKAIIVKLRHRNDIEYSAINQYLLYNNNKYIIQNAPTNINLENTEVEIVAIREATTTITQVEPITAETFDNTFDLTFK